MRPEIENLLAKKDFSEGLFKLDDTSKVKDYFATEGNLKDITDDEVKELGTGLGNLMQNIAKLPEDKLEKIGGGVGDDDDFAYLAGMTVHAAEAPIGAHSRLDNPVLDPLRDDSVLPFIPGVGAGKKNMSIGKKVGIGVAALGGLAAAGAGIYKIGKSRGWWDKFKRK